MRFYLIITMVLSLTTQLFAIDDLQLHLKVIALEEPSAPEFYFNEILFTAEPEEGTRHIGIAFAHEDFKVVHSFQRNEMGLFFYLMEIPVLNHLDYRLIIDGIWQEDPMAQERVMGSNGISLSRLVIPQNSRPRQSSPVIHENGMVEFIIEAMPGQMVYLAGDFNQWDPYMIKMEETEPGQYHSFLRMSMGTHYYNFFINGETLTDPKNRNIQVNSFGEEVSIVYIP